MGSAAVFPMLPRHNLPSVQPAVRDICRRNGLHYNSVPFFQALRLCLDNIARFKRPKDYKFVDALPKNNYGKILKTELRTRL